MEKILFISNRIYFDISKPEGGVRVCTLDFINLLQCRYELIHFHIDYKRSFIYRIKARLGVDVFEDYRLKSFEKELFNVVRTNSVSKVFINLASASKIAISIKNEFGDSVKVILCSHGTESGDFLHHTVRFHNFFPSIKRRTSAWRLGKIMQMELEYRMKYFDAVLTVSEIEKSIEYWMGAKRVFFIPRVYSPEYIEWKPVMGRLGFIADVSHYPNYFGLLLLCEEISKNTTNTKIEIRVAGKYCKNLELLKKKFDFITILGHLSNEELIIEACSWMYYLNLVFYYSKGVSTKLAKGMNWGIPVLSTTAGNRGYIFKQGSIVVTDTPNEMVEHIYSRIENLEFLQLEREQVKMVVDAFKDYNIVMNDLYPFLSSI